MKKITVSENLKTRADRLEKNVIERLKNIIIVDYAGIDNSFYGVNFKISTLDKEIIEVSDEQNVIFYQKKLLFNTEQSEFCFERMVEVTNSNQQKFFKVSRDFFIDENKVICNDRMRVKVSNVDKIFKDSLKANALSDLEIIVSMASHFLRKSVQTKSINFISYETDVSKKDLLDVINIHVKMSSESNFRSVSMLTNKKLITQKSYWRAIAYIIFEDVFNVFDKKEFCFMDINAIQEQMRVMSY